MSEEQQNGGFKKPLASEMIRGKGTSYYIDIRLSKNDTPYLSICTSRRRAGQEKPERNCIFIFQDDLQIFFEGINRIAEAAEKVAK
ncbi:MAG: hypothetical protein UT11_C0051G0005 [Berkelbacteria bacterium GW2011_GWA2_38_9]|uniref:PUR-alpha/beta/gamma DNA/RNA-binding protein n=1 Tax=Berkelbacteria bacterium GW2011_GWA2_38_9 TaxID=1618334 RepID=A0A0G0L928_9BACT|nr:MAG: hypothetical protein UT11_C0051G0005 [Berkelbacteria bacterium GW2011_GWA2_38_9]